MARLARAPHFAGVCVRVPSPEPPPIMPLEPCRECHREISTEARSCPHCGAPHPARATAAPRRRPWPIIGAFAGVLLLAAAAFAFLLTSPSRRGAEERAAWSACTDAVRSRLRTPARAAFAEPDDAGVRIFEAKSGGYEVHGYVDSQNSFGAVLRTYYRCTAHQSGDGWTASDIATGEDAFAVQ